MSESERNLFAKRHEYDRKARGDIIYAAVVLESLIERIIARHFTKDTWLFVSLVFGEGQITFSQKLVILKKLFRQVYSDLIFPGMFNRLDKLRELRNKLAHSKVGHSLPVEMSWDKESIDSLPEGTVLEYFKTGYMVHEELPKQVVDDALQTANDYEQLLALIELEVEDRINGKTNMNRFDDLKRTKPELFKS